MMAENLLYAAVYLAEALIVRLYFSYIYTPTRSRHYTFVSFALGYVFLFLAFQLGVILVNCILYVIVNTVLLALNYACERRSALLHAAFLTLVMGASELLANLAVMAFTGDFASYTYSFAVLIPLAVFSKLLYFFITVIAARLFKPHKDSSGEPNQIALLCVMPLISVLISVSFIYIAAGAQLTSLTKSLIFVSLFALMIANILVFVVYNRLQKLDKEYAAFQISQLRDQANTAYYEMLQRQYDDQRILIHDVKKHFNVIALLAGEGDSRKIREYLSQLEALPEFQHRARLCDEPILNMVLLHYAEQCAEKNIRFSCDVRSGAVSFMDATSITALFGNLLSNAVEAAERSEERMIELSVIKSAEQNMVLVSMVNSCDIAPIKDASGNFQTTKDREGGHGYGTRSINRVVLKYDGLFDMRYDKTAREFHSVFRFSLPRPVSVTAAQSEGQ